MWPRQRGELVVEPGVEVDHVTVYRSVQQFTPLLADGARFTRHAPGDRWYLDETYAKVNRVWREVYRAVEGRAYRDGHDGTPVYAAGLMRWSNRRSTTYIGTGTTRYRLIIASSNTGYDPCAGCAPIRSRR